LQGGPPCSILTRMEQKNDNGVTDAESRPRGSCHDWLLAYREQSQREHGLYRRLETRWSWIRLAAFVAGLLGAVLLRHNPLFAMVAGAGGLAAFLGAVLRHTKYEERRAFIERVLTVIGESLHASTNRDRPARAWQRPEDPADPSASLPIVLESGPTWPLTDQERDDLDLYGAPVGIFGLLNRTSTELGARRLRDMLDAPCLSGTHIQGRQRAVQWLSVHSEKRLGLMASAVLLRNRSERLDRIVPLLRQAKRPSRSIVSGAIRLWSAFSGLFFVFAVLRVADGQDKWGRALAMLFAVNILILLLSKPLLRRRNVLVSPWTNLRFTLNRFLAVARHADQDLPDAEQLGVLKGHFHRVVADARIPSLCAWLDWAGLHGIVRGLLNLVVFLDLHIAEAVLAHIVPHRDVLLCGLSAVADLEALCGLACFSAEQPVACYPKPSTQTDLTIEDGRHPLLLEKDVTPNSVHLTSDRRTWVVTGPNAAGKSTFLRMVGVNVLLAQIGAAAAAREMTWSPVRLITDVRIRDDLARHESYFLSEVRRLRRLVLDAENGAPLLGLIDEPFRGTNSQERTAAGTALLEHLMASRHLFLIATHEEILARVAANTASAENYHFQEDLHDGGITFDYCLRPGPATTKTALRILEREGYPKALLERARGLMPPEQ